LTQKDRVSDEYCECVAFAIVRESARDKLDWPKKDGARQGVLAMTWLDA
jgi:hypothetical protein